MTPENKALFRSVLDFIPQADVPAAMSIVARWMIEKDPQMATAAGKAFLAEQAELRAENASLRAQVIALGGSVPQERDS